MVLAFSIVFFLNKGFWSGHDIDRYTGTHDYSEPSWFFTQGETVLNEDITTPAFSHMETGKPYRISTFLTYDGKNDDSPTCFFFVDHMFCRVLLDGEEIFRYMPEDIQRRDLAKSPGNVYVSVPLPKDCYGKELTIEFVPSLNPGIDYQLPNPVFGDYATQTAYIFVRDLPIIIIIILAFFMGLGSVLYSLFAMPPDSREGIYLGIFAMLFSIYNITECDFAFYIIANPYYTYVIDYFSFSMIPIFFMAFLHERLDAKRKKITLAFIIASVVMTLTEIVLHFSGIIDMREFLPILHIAYFLCFIVTFILIATMKNNQWKIHLILQMIPILSGIVVDAAVYYFHLQLGSSDSTFTALGVIILLISELYHAWKSNVDVYIQSVKSRDYQKMAFIDSLTGIGNHRAFDSEKDLIISGKKKFRSLIVVSVDINNLKYSNDTYGHASGDFLIRSAANLLTDFSEGCGQAFRMGGDEFLVFMYDIDEEEFENRLKKLDSQTDDINSNSKVKIGMALGSEIYKGDIAAAIEKADRNMYINKAKMKACENA